MAQLPSVGRAPAAVSTKYVPIAMHGMDMITSRIANVIERRGTNLYAMLPAPHNKKGTARIIPVPTRNGAPNMTSNCQTNGRMFKSQVAYRLPAAKAPNHPKNNNAAPRTIPLVACVTNVSATAMDKTTPTMAPRKITGLKLCVMAFRTTTKSRIRVRKRPPAISQRPFFTSLRPSKKA